jgi:Mn2+/Fe2+ NRAMP family transporter
MLLFAISLLPATIFAVIGYFVVFASTRSEGGIKRFGQYLGGWVLFLAAFTALGGAVAPIVGVESLMGGFLDGMTQHMETMSSVEEQQLEMLQELQRN